MSYLQRICAVMAVWQLCACGRIIGIEDLPALPPDASPPPDAAPEYTVKGTAVGLLEPVSLRLEHPGGLELLRVEEDGTFAFAAELAAGDQSDNSVKDSGAVYVFRRDGTSWRQETYIKASNPGSRDDLIVPTGDPFGISLSLHGDTLAVGANYESSSATGYRRRISKHRIQMDPMRVNCPGTHLV